jgi:predicted RNA-binding Zn ribbon-like protein
MDDDRLRLADPRLAVALLSTLRHDGDGLVDHLDDRRSFRSWLRDHLHTEVTGLSDADLDELVAFRDQLRVLFTAEVDGQPLPPSVLAVVNDAAGRAPVTLATHQTVDGILRVERVPTAADALTEVRGEFARAALALLTDDLRQRLRLCRAPSCVLFFLKEHPRQQWCSPSCGNRARVARHAARHRRATA